MFCSYGNQSHHSYGGGIQSFVICFSIAYKCQQQSLAQSLLGINVAPGRDHRRISIFTHKDKQRSNNSGWNSDGLAWPTIVEERSLLWWVASSYHIKSTRTSQIGARRGGTMEARWRKARGTSCPPCKGSVHSCGCGGERDAGVVVQTWQADQGTNREARSGTTADKLSKVRGVIWLYIMVANICLFIALIALPLN